MSKEVHHFEDLGGTNKKAYQADFLNSNGEAVDQFLVSGYVIRQRFATGCLQVTISLTKVNERIIFSV